ncbi:CYFA0S33e00562g1_1 [Cyberlindnera fabianii]|uniref:CYFA0S33e00562g1_1 n=1 Tax=Cyberlindnera fabianii TaxID=36022 RepID=A0A061BC93_CYBFA|nr:CYFA0S33e00562g1_1 [Cyberlindnera fabianii]
MPENQYVIIGAGIVGLYTTYELITNLGADPKTIHVVAEYLPGDQSINYTSPWAGGNFSGISPSDPDSLAFDKFTYINLPKIQKLLGGPECGLDYKPSTELWESDPPAEKVASLKTYMKDYRVLPKSELPEGVKFGTKSTVWNFNCPIFLANLQKYLESIGVTFERRVITHISQAYLFSSTKYVFNCSGIGARFLGGVQDANVYPTRGQVVVARAPHIQENMMRWGEGYATYIIPRPHSNGELVLGGFLGKDDWTGDTFKEQTDDIIKRTTELLPEILDKPLVISRVAAGLRPSRHGGVRIELEEIQAEGKVLIHNYGASGYGYQSGLGMAHKAVELLKAYKRKNKL